MRLKWILYIGILLLASCTPPATRQFLSQTGRSTGAILFFKQLDHEVEKAGVANRHGVSLTDFPYLAVNRFLEAEKKKLGSGKAQESWLNRLYELSAVKRDKEIRNLPPDAVDRFYHEYKLIDEPSRASLIRKSQQLAHRMLQEDRKQTGFLDAVKTAAVVPDDYSTALRVVGLYPVVALPVAYVSDGFFDKLRSWHQMPYGELQLLGKLVTYRSNSDLLDNNTAIERIFSPSNKDPLGLPGLTEEDRLYLVERFAPVVIQDMVADYDRIGRIAWDGSSQIRVNPNRPVVYHYLSNAYFKGQPIWQINYVFWYSGRLGDNAPWYERGLIDGITLRVSLDPQGQPFMIDLMNNCGCSHQFFPRKDLVKNIRERSMKFDALVPAWMPDDFPDKRIQIRVNSGWHQIQFIGTNAPGTEEVTYDLIPYDNLESLPVAGNESKSMFNQDGIAYGSDRVEPYFFFPMGIRDVGAMRQRGHHPIALIGRSHFDDPHLFDLHFEWE